MKLDKIEIESFRSIDSSTIYLEHDCIGLVGINESGKTNVLDSIKTLDPNFKLAQGDLTKESQNNTKIIFHFKPDDDIKNVLLDLINSFLEDKSIGCTVQSSDDIQILYEVEYDVKDKMETRTFYVKGVELNEDARFLINGHSAGAYEIKIDENMKELKSAWVVKEDILIKEDINVQLNNEIEDIKNSILELKLELESIEEEGEKKDREKEISEKEKEIANKEKHVTFNISTKTREIQNKIKLANEELAEASEKMIALEKAKVPLDKLATKTATQQKKIATLGKSIRSTTKLISKLKNDLLSQGRDIEKINNPISENYSNDKTIFEEDLGNHLREHLDKLLPEIIFWESKPEYILPSSIDINELISSETKLIPRPLFNMFRIALGTEDKEQFIQTLKELSENGSKRSKANVKLNTKVNEYIKQVWKEYDQELKITVEQELIRIEVFDPTREDEANFYELIERSQGCKTFLSFILTIGAESQTNLIKNKILLLDEPETHLHPSGQRYLLKELRKISEKNKVIYATHSNHMIIRDNYDQHLIVSKTKDKTELNLSRKDRIGYFMQEEVLYDALGVNLSSDLSTIEDFNFVCEGVGDVVIFKQYYDKVATSEERPFKFSKTKFYHGGKCSDIKKAFTSRPIQLGTKWVFLLDSDKPADDLSKFLLGRYKDYKDKDIFVFQYPKEGKEAELEDLIEVDQMLEVYETTFKHIGLTFDKQKIKKIITDSKAYGLYSKTILENIVGEKEEEFIPVFKETLNKSIFEKCHNSNTKDKFEKAFPKYYKFAKDVLTQINTKK